MTTEDLLDIFSELPYRVKQAIVSNIHSMRSRHTVSFTVYDRDVAEYIAFSGLMAVEIGEHGFVRFRANEHTHVLRYNITGLLEMV